ncbi:MAG TPA: NADH-quinone oxidoreductase subunit NuoK [Nitrospiraceae bacterium]|nr:NADH-quinone oxidoreductase subunit NuoK [Nitrospiraceae bacterium]
MASEALALAALLFSVGLAALLVRRNVLYVLMAVEIMMNAAGLAFVAGGATWGQPDGQVMFVFILTLAAAEVSVGLGLVLLMYERFRTMDLEALTSMRG